MYGEERDDTRAAMETSEHMHLGRVLHKGSTRLSATELQWDTEYNFPTGDMIIIARGVHFKVSSTFLCSRLLNHNGFNKVHTNIVSQPDPYV